MTSPMQWMIDYFLYVSRMSDVMEETCILWINVRSLTCYVYLAAMLKSSFMRIEIK